MFRWSLKGNLKRYMAGITSPQCKCDSNLLIQKPRPSGNQSGNNEKEVLQSNLIGQLLTISVFKDGTLTTQFPEHDTCRLGRPESCACCNWPKAISFSESSSPEIGTISTILSQRSNSHFLSCCKLLVGDNAIHPKWLYSEMDELRLSSMQHSVTCSISKFGKTGPAWLGVLLSVMHHLVHVAKPQYLSMSEAPNCMHFSVTISLLDKLQTLLSSPLVFVEWRCLENLKKNINK